MQKCTNTDHCDDINYSMIWSFVVCQVNLEYQFLNRLVSSYYFVKRNPNYSFNIWFNVIFVNINATHTHAIIFLHHNHYAFFVVTIRSNDNLLTDKSINVSIITVDACKQTLK